MFVDNKKKVIFFHNPKTAGRSTMKMFGFCDDKSLKLTHLLPVEAKDCIFQDSWAQFFKFCFVRNPWDRLVSLYKYHRSVEYALFQRMNTSHGLAHGYSFEDWIRLNNSKLCNSNYFGVPQASWCEGVDKVYKFEDYHDAVVDISSYFGRAFEEVRVNVSPSDPDRKHYRDFYETSEAIEIVRVIDSEVISKFKYDF